MSDELAFLSGIREQPRDHLRRLVFADWLEEHGSEEFSAKARFLRVWCELDDIPLTDLAGYPERAEQLEELGKTLPADWLATVDGLRFRIRTPEQARTRAAAFLLRHKRVDATLESVEPAGDQILVWYRDFGESFIGSEGLSLPWRLQVDVRTGRVVDHDRRFTEEMGTVSGPGSLSPISPDEKAKPSEGPHAALIQGSSVRYVLHKKRAFWGYVQIYSLLASFAGFLGMLLLRLILPGEYGMVAMAVLFGEAVTFLFIFMVSCLLEK